MHEGRRDTQRAWPPCHSQNVHELIPKTLEQDYSVKAGRTNLVVLLVRQVQERVVTERRAGRRRLELAVVLDLLNMRSVLLLHGQVADVRGLAVLDALAGLQLVKRDHVEDLCAGGSCQSLALLLY